MFSSYGSNEEENLPLFNAVPAQTRKPASRVGKFFKKGSTKAVATISVIGLVVLAVFLFVNSSSGSSSSDGSIESGHEIGSTANLVTVDEIMGKEYSTFEYNLRMDELTAVDDLDYNSLQSTEGVEKPNILYILADDVGYNDIGYLSDDFSKVTPVINRLAKEGVKLRNYYAQALCTPSRAALMTGMYPSNSGMEKKTVGDASLFGLPLDLKLMPEYLQDGGYDTHHVGKWHLGHYYEQFLPNKRGFDTSFGFLTGDEDYFTHAKEGYDVDVLDLTYGNESGYYQVDTNEEGIYSASLYTEHTVNLIEQSAKDKDPFFIYLSLQNSQEPAVEPPTYYFSDLDQDIFETATTSKMRQTYAKMMNVIDKSMLRIINALDSTDQLKNTIVVFASDNGGCRAAGSLNYPYRGSKGYPWEGGVKVASFVFAPSFMSADVIGGEYTGLFHVTDWMPTLLSAANLAPTTYKESEAYWSNPIDGFDQWDELTTELNPAEAPRVDLLLQLDMLSDDMTSGLLPDDTQNMAFRYNNYKLMRLQEEAPVYTVADLDRMLDSGASSCYDPEFVSLDPSVPPKHEFLFDLNADPYESNNLAADLRYADVKEMMYEKVAALTETSRKDVNTADDAECAVAEWSTNGGYVTPWKGGEFVEGDDASYAAYGPGSC